jgi:hypothetical protein
MIDSQNWDRLERFIENGAGLLAVPHVVHEIKDQLTPEQLEPLGDLTEVFIGFFSKKMETRPRDFVAHFIDMAKQGVIKKKN